nr:MAG TPA_asm: minor tail protein [Caudoviricetes sp.]
MADVDITSLSVEISAESQGAELNIDKLATAISNLRTKGNVTKVVNSLDKLASSIATLKQASAGMSGLDKITSFLNGLSNVNTTASTKSINTVVNAIKKIPAAVSGLNGVDFYSMSGSITQLTNALVPLSILDASNLKALGSAFNAIGKVPDLTDKLKATDFDSFASSCQKISTALTPLASQLDKVGNAFAKLPPQLSKVVTQANRVTAANEKQRKSYLSLSNQINGFMRNMAKLVSLKAIAEYLGNAVAKFNDFYEATDLFHNAMGDLSGEADTLISKMQGLLGVDPTKAMTYMATIQSLGTSFGLASDKAYVLSKNLTQLAYDEASYWNKDVAETFTAMSSAISGEIEPIRRLGVDLSQARLQQELLALGFNKQVSSLSQADKAVLRYIAIMKQTANIQGNLAQTIQSPANQIKILKAQLNMLAKSVGSLLYPALKSILPPLIAAVQLIREFVEWVAKLMGVKVTFTDFSKGVGSGASSIGDVGDAMDKTAGSTKKAAKALKDYTMGFDELNIIDPTQGDSGSSGSGGGASGNILGDVDLSGYDMFADYLGTQIDEVKQKIKDMLPIIWAVTAALALWKIVDFLTDVATAISKMTDLQKLALSIATVVIEASLVFSFAKGYASSGNPLELLGEVVSAAFGSFVLWRTMGADGITLGMGVAFVASLAGLTYALSTGEANLGDASAWIQSALTTAFGSIAGITLLTNLGVAAGTAATLSIGLAGLITFTGITFSLGEKLKEFPVLDTIITALMGIFGGVAGAGIALLFGASLPVAGAVAAAGVGIGLVLHWAGIKWGAKESGEKTDAAAEADIKMHYVENVFEQRIEAIKQIIVTKWNAVIDFMTSLPEKVGNIVNGIGEWFGSLPEKIGYALGFAVGKIGEWVGNMVVTATTEVPKIISSVVKFFEELPGKILTEILKALDSISEWRKKMIALALIEVPKIVSSIVDEFKKIGDGLRKLGKFIWDGLINGLKGAWSTVTNGIKGFTDGFINGFKNALGIHSPSKVFYEIGDYVVQGFTNGINAALPYVEQAMNNMADKVKEAGEGMIDAGANAANDYLDGFFNGLDSKWSQLKSSFQNDFTGTIKSLVDAVKQGDIKTVGTTTAAIIWQAMGEQNRNEVKSYANNLVSNLVKAFKGANTQIYGAAKNIGTSILNGITSQFSNIASQAVGLGNKIMTSFASMSGPMAVAGNAISVGLSSGVLSQFPSIIAGVAGLIGQVGTAFMGLLQTIGSVLTSLGIPTGVLLIAGGVAIAAAITGIVGALGGKFSSSKSDASVSTDISKYPGTSDYDKTTGSGTVSSGSYTTNPGVSAEEIRGSVYNGCYNAFLDIFQRYGDEITGGKEIKLYIDGKQITASVEKQQNSRGQSLMGSEIYSY